MLFALKRLFAAAPWVEEPIKASFKNPQKQSYADISRK
jgi:hypothetical protein